jgi:glucose uptake protein
LIAGLTAEIGLSAIFLAGLLTIGKTGIRHRGPFRHRPPTVQPQPPRLPMDAIGLLYAIVTVLAWGTWLAPSEKVALPNAISRAFYIAVGNMVLSTIVLFAVAGPAKLTGTVFLYPFLGGLIWSLGALCAFSAIARIGMARAFGIWAPLNILTGFAWGMILFGEFLKAGTATMVLAAGSLGAIIAGLLLIIFSGGASGEQQPRSGAGFAFAIGAGVLWGTYFVPTAFLAQKVPGLSGWVTAFPLAVGMLVGSGALVLLAGQAPKCAGAGAYARVVSSGALWSVGNFAMLLMVAAIGMAKGFTIAQMCVVVNALVGIFVMKNPAPGTRAANLTLVGVVLATLGGVLLGNLKAGM